MIIRAGAEDVMIHRETLLRTIQGNVTMVTAKYLRPRGLVNSKEPTSDYFNYQLRTNYYKVRITTEAHTPFFWTGPSFGLVFDHRTPAPQSWVDVMISAKSVEKSYINGNCLDFYHLHEYILFTRIGPYKLKSDASRMYSLLVDLNVVNKNKTVRLILNLDTKSCTSGYNLVSTVFLKWTSVVVLSRDTSRKTIALPGTITLLTFKALNFLWNFTADIHSITDMFTRSSFQSNDVTSCEQELLPIKHEFCVNYTSTQKNYIFFWNIYRHERCNKDSQFNPWLWREKYYEQRFYGISSDFSEPIHCRDPSLPKREVAKSSTEASQLCKSIGGSLPIIRNKEEVNELITFLKLSEDMPPVEALYMGIKRTSENQVLTLSLKNMLHFVNNNDFKLNIVINVIIGET